MGHIVQRLVRNAILQAVNQVIQKLSLIHIFPMSHLRRKLCQQGLPQFLCLISIAQTWNPYPFVFCPRPGFSSFGAGMRLASFQERS